MPPPCRLVTVGESRYILHAPSSPSPPLSPTCCRACFAPRPPKLFRPGGVRAHHRVFVVLASPPRPKTFQSHITRARSRHLPTSCSEPFTASRPYGPTACRPMGKPHRAFPCAPAATRVGQNRPRQLRQLCHPSSSGRTQKQGDPIAPRLSASQRITNNNNKHNTSSRYVFGTKGSPLPSAGGALLRKSCGMLASSTPRSSCRRKYKTWNRNDENCASKKVQLELPFFCHTPPGFLGI